MKLNFINSTSFTPVKDIEIPSIYNRRVKCGIPEVDEMFGAGILPGSVITISSKAGVGKSTMVLQIMNGMAKNGRSVGYVSAEESIHQVAFACRRLGITEVGICNESKIGAILSMMDGMETIVIDSFQAIDREGYEEKTVIEMIVQRAKEVECAVIIICHLTKSGAMRGNNLLTYAVDVNVFVELGENPGLRRIHFTKNRFGPGIDFVCSFTAGGYDFTPMTANPEAKTTKKADKKEKEKTAILNLNGQFNITTVCEELQIDATRAYCLLRELTLEGKITKNDKRGTKTKWKVNKIEATIVAH